MADQITFRGVFPIGDTKVGALPVRELGPAIAYYTKVLGFKVESKSSDTAILVRDEIRIGLAKNGEDPEQASCYFEVVGIEALQAEYAAAGIEPTGIKESKFDGRAQKIFFAKEPFGVCFCFGETAQKV